MGGPLTNTDAVEGPPIPMELPTRRDTSSSISSSESTPIPIPPGFYTLPIHGNCPRCHHHHKAARINVRVSGDVSQVSHVYCEKCQEKWLAFGGGNSTRISLLSTQTVEPDLVERNFRHALINMVRSVTSIASVDALAVVHEQPSGGPSREHSIRSHNVQDKRDKSPPDTVAAQRSIPAHDTSSKARPISHDRTRTADILGDVERSTGGPKNMLRRLKKSVKDRLMLLKKLRLKQLDVSKRVKWTAKGRGKLPVIQNQTADNSVNAAKNLETTHTDVTHDKDAWSVAKRSRDGSNNDLRGSKRPPRGPPNMAEISHGAAKRGKKSEGEEPATHLAPHLASNMDKETLKGMTMEQRIAWIREQFSDFKCHCPGHCYCRRPSISFSSSTSEDNGSHLHPPPPSPQVPVSGPIQRRHSYDLRFVGTGFVGSHMDNFQAGELFYHSRPLSFESTTRFSSQAATAVNSESVTATSGGPYLDVGQQQRRQRSRSPRPMSLPPGPSRLRQSIISEDFEPGRPSTESFASTGPVRSPTPMSWQTDRRSITSTPSRMMPVADMEPNAPHMPSPHINGFRPSDEPDRTSSSTTTL